MHCSDEDLVAYLDGELPAQRRKRTERHLHSCWPCRTRLAAAEQQIQRLTRQVEEWSLPEQKAATGKQRLNSGIRELEAGLLAEQQPRLRQWWSRQKLWSATAAAALAGLAVTAWWWSGRVRESPIVTASAAITYAAAVESELYTKPLQQTFRVEIAELKPAPANRSTRLEVLTDQQTGRFASRWTAEDGVLKYAVWRPGQGESDVLYNPAVSRSAVPWTSASNETLPLAFLAEYGLDAAEVEGAFLRWLESSGGRAISFTSDLATWSHQDGTTLEAELVQEEGEPPAMRVTASRTTKRLTAILRVDFDSNSYRPRLQTLRFETPERAVEFRLTATRIRTLPSSELTSGLFSPDETLLAKFVPPGPSAPPAGAAPSLNAPAVLSSGSAADNHSEALEAQYILHQAGACLGEPVRIEDRPDGVRIESLGQGPWRESFTSRARFSTVLNAFAELRDAAPPLSYVPEATDEGFAAATAVRHAWALTRLAQHFPPSATAALSPEDWRLLEIMVREHVTRIDAELHPFHLPASAGKMAVQRGWRYSTSVVLESLTSALALLRDEPIAKVAPLLEEVDAELHAMSKGFLSDYLRSQATVR